MLVPRRTVLKLAAVAGLAPLALARPARAAGAMPVVATFSILADFVRRLGGERVSVDVLVGPGDDPHVYSPTPADARKLRAARLVVANGLGFEGWIARLLKVSGTDAPVIEAGRAVPVRDVDPARVEHGDRSHAGQRDPHAWQSLANGRLYARAIAEGLAAADPEGAAGYAERARAYDAELAALDAEILAILAPIPPARRRLITSHDAFGYFAAERGFAFLAPQGVSSESQPSAKEVAALIRQARQEKVGAIFLEAMADPRLARRIADEAGARLGGTLYADTLSPAGGPAATYVEMMRHNARQLAAALAPAG